MSSRLAISRSCCRWCSRQNHRAGAEALGKAAVRLAGVWKLQAAASALVGIARSEREDEALRAEAFEALANIGGNAGFTPIAGLAKSNVPEGTRLLAITALARLNLSAASAHAAEILSSPAQPGRKLVPLLRAILDRQGGSETLAKALRERSIPADSAKLALRAVYTLGRSDQALVDALSRAAGISELSKPLSPTELSNMVAEVAAKGDPARGEQVFRRTDLNCMSCHSVSKAGGDVGPDLSSLGQISPPDYIINSILNPDIAIKEQYNTLVVLTVDGRVLQGIVADKDDQRVVLKDATGSNPGRARRLYRRPEDGRVAHAEGACQSDDAGRVPGPGSIPFRAWQARAVCNSPRAGDPALEGSQSGSRGAGEIRSRRQRPSRTSPWRLAEKWDVVYGKVDGSLPLEEAISRSGSTVVYLQGAVDVSAAGSVMVQLDSAAGTRLWIDEEAAAPKTLTLSKSLGAGRHSITVRIDTGERQTPATIRALVAKPSGSEAEFTVVGGR